MLPILYSNETMTTVNKHTRAVRNSQGGLLRANHRWNSEFTRKDGRMTKCSTAIGHKGSYGRQNYVVGRRGSPRHEHISW